MLGSTADDIGVFPEMKEKGEHGASIRDASTGALRWKTRKKTGLRLLLHPCPVRRRRRSVPFLRTLVHVRNPGPKLAPENRGDYASAKK